METLFVVEQHKNQYYYSRSKSQQGHARFGGSPSRGFRDINCRTFESGRTGILPTPLKSHAHGHASPKTPPNSEKVKVTPKSTPIPINGKACRIESEIDVPSGGGGLLFSELWAGPTYSNSPPPSSLPIPKFSVRLPKRTVSLDLPGSSSPEIEMRRPVVKSAPSSPSRELLDLPFTRDIFDNADSATKTLCRILNLNINDD